MAPMEKRLSVDKMGKGGALAVIEHSSDRDLLCGFFGWKPRWMQVFNNMKVFMFCYVCLGIFRGISFSYFSAMLPSVEKRFGFTSQSIGTVKAMNDVSHLISALIIAHFGGAGHRPRWMAAGSLLVGIGFLMMASPEVFFPANQISSLAQVLSTNSDASEPMCNGRRNASMLGSAGNCSKHSTDDHIGPLIVLGAAEFVIGLGSTAAMILGMPFVDDNVENKNSPLYFAISFSGFIFGPVLGIALASFFNTIYFDFSHPDFKPSDPRWISAWYLGFIISGFGTCVMALIISCFPIAISKKKSGRKVHSSESEDMPPSGTGTVLKMEEKKDISTVAKVGADAAHKPKPVTLKDLPINLKRLLTNSTYMIKLSGQLMSSFALSGYMSFMQKFLKEQYQLPQSYTNLAGGLPPIFAGFLGIGLGSIFIRRFKLRPTQVCLLMACTSLIGSACYFSAIAMGCDKQPIVGVDDVSNPYDLSAEALCVNSHHCNCMDNQFSPICDTDTGKSYVSACIAGCRGATRKDGTKHYYDCLCTGHNATGFIGTPKPRQFVGPRKYVLNSTRQSAVRGGVCPKHCENFKYYVIVMTISKFFMGIPSSGIFMLQFRIVDVDLKSLASGLTTVVMSALGMLPAPIIMGKVIDSACRLWQKSSCGARGACWIYNADEFRWKLHTLVGTVRFLNCLIELVIAYKVRNMTFDRNADKERAEKAEEAVTTSSQINLVPEENNDDFPAEMQRSEVFNEARRRSIYLHDVVP